MNPIDFLTIAAAKTGRPALTWAHHINLFGETVAVSTDGERMSVVWGDIPYAYLWNNRVIQLPGSVTIDDEKSIALIEATFTKLLDFSPVTVSACLRIKELEAALQSLTSAFCLLVMTPGKGTWVVSGDTLKTIPSEVYPPITHNTSVCFNPSYMLDALKGLEGDEVTIEFNAAATYLPFLVGTWGERAAVIMPIAKPMSLMTTDLLGGM